MIFALGHQRKMHGRTGALSLAGGDCRASIPAAHDKAQVGLTQVPGRFLPVRTGGGLAERSRLFSQFMCCAHSPQFERRRRQVGADVLPRTRSVATNLLDMMAAKL